MGGHEPPPLGVGGGNITSLLNHLTKVDHLIILVPLGGLFHAD
jgi:hypothetical protein